MAKYTSRQWLTLVVLALGNLFEACAASLMAPFFPSEAEAKGVSPSIYGFIFGVYTLVMCLAAPIFGKFITQIGLKRMYNIGIFTSSVACIAFAFIIYIDDTNTFIGVSFIIRIIAAMGHTAFTCTSFTITAKEFSDNVGSVFGTLGTCYGTGYIIGPLIGGALYAAGGFLLPFIVLGCTLLLFSTVSLFIFPKDKSKIDSSNNKEDKEEKSQPGFLSLLRIPSTCLFIFALFCGSFCIGYFVTGLEVHLRQFDLSPLEIGSMFIIEGAFYSLCAPLWGKLIEKILHPIIALQIGSLIIFASYFLLGPAPFLPISTNLILVIIGLAMYGVGFGAVFVVAFNGLLISAKECGFPDNIGTHGFVSGIFTSTFSLGLFVGSSAGGILLDYFGFRMGTIVPIVLLFMVAISPSIYLCLQIKTKVYTVKV